MPRFQSRFPSLILFLVAFVLDLLTVAASPTVYNAEDITAISLYGPSAVYLPENCPQTIHFTGRARHLPELAEDKIGIFPREIIVNGNRCTSDAIMLDFAPLGPTQHFPPQWVFEDSRFHGHPVNFTCGDTSFSIRFGYFNDVRTEATAGFLASEVVYLDFAVIPNSRPFSFCSYAGRRTDGKRPLDFAPFPNQRTWEAFHELRRRTHPDFPSTGPAVSPEPRESPEPQASVEADDMNEQDMPQDNGQMMNEGDSEETQAPGLDRAASVDDPFSS